MTDFDDMLKRAEYGDPTAQGFLAHALPLEEKGHAK